ncbi:MAG: glycosyltransferase [Cyclobacteriaceae bacterium]|nr:MAG: glycosyltransferase [Cyclobacteriaceae bacterium]
MKVIYLVGTLGAGGLERFVTRMALMAKRTGAFTPAIICLTSKTGLFLAQLEQAGVEVVQGPSGWYRSLIGVYRLKNTIAKLNGDIVHSQVNYSLLQQFLASVWAGSKYAVTERSKYSRSGMDLVRRRIQFRILKFFEVRYSANAVAVAQHLSKMVGVPVEYFTVIPNGVEITSPNLEKIATIKRRLNIGVEDFTIGYVARMDPPKGHLFLLNVLRILIIEKKLPCKVLLVGDGSMRKLIEERIHEFGLSDYIILTGVVADVEDWMPVFDMVMLLSNREGMPNAILEAMAASRPIVATAVGNIPELLGNEAGIVVAHDADSANVADLVESLMNDKAKRQFIGEKACEKIRDLYSIEKTWSKLLAYYEAILGLKRESGYGS